MFNATLETYSHSYGNVAFVCEGLHDFAFLSVLIAIEQWELFV